MAEGYHRREIAKWRHTRLLATVLLNVNRGEGDAALTPEEVMPLPGDTPEGPEITQEEFESELARVAEIDKDWL